MKTTTLFILLAFISCSKDNPQQPQLPPETQIGANTFGCYINGKVLIPRGGTPGSSLDRAFIILGGPTPDDQYIELEIYDFKSERTGNILIHIQYLSQIVVGDYIIDESNGSNGIDGEQHTNLYCRVFDSKTNSYQYYRSYENSGLLKITKIEIVPGEKSIISGVFTCKVRNSTNPSDEISITEGRFDVDGHTLPDKIFP